MFKLYKSFSWKDWIGVAVIIGLTFLQVYLTMTIVDYIQGIIKAITFVNYHNNPGDFSKEFAGMVQLYGWDGIKAIASTMGPDGEALISIADATTKDIWSNGLIMVGLAFGLMFVQGIVSLTASYVCANLSTNVRTKLYNKVSTYSMAEINGFSTASLITRATNDIQQVQIANIMMLRMIFAAPITAVWAIIKIKASSTELTIATAIAIVILLVFIFALMIIAIPKFKVIQKYTDSLNGVTRENLTGIRIVRAFNAEKYQEDKFNKTNENFTKTQIFVGKVMSLMSPAMMIIMNGISLAIYWIGSSLINKGTIDYPTVTAFMALSSQIIMSFVMLMMMFVLWPRASVCAHRINEALDTTSSIIDPENPKEFIEQSTFEFKNVSFKYPGSSDYAIQDISFKANKGETVAIIGATGSGKTTLVNLLPRIYDSTVGEILVDGINVKEVKQKELRNKIGYVPQKGFLFSGSIKENIALGNPNMSQEEIKFACDISCSSEFIEAKEGKFDFQISQGGKNVSGGQKQRLCIARAVAIKPEILIFDDSFSALDYVTDKKVRSSLKENLKDTTKLIVAQRIGTIIDADKIIVLDEGKMVGEGTHNELLKNCPIYKEIALSQLSADELGIKEVR